MKAIGTVDVPQETFMAVLYQIRCTGEVFDFVGAIHELPLQQDFPRFDEYPLR